MNDNFLTTKKQFKELHKKIKMEEGCHELLQEYQVQMLKKLISQSKIHAKHSNRKNLQKKDASFAIKMTKEIYP